MKEIFFLLLVKVDACLVFDVTLELSKLNLTALHLEQFESSFPHIINPEQLDLILHGEGEIGAGKIDEHGVIVDIHERHGALIRYIIIEMDELLR